MMYSRISDTTRSLAREAWIATLVTPNTELSRGLGAASPTEACALAFHAEARAFRKTAAFRFGPPTSTVAASFSPLASRSRSWTYWRGGDG